MRSIEIEIVNRLGLHARAAAKFVTLASRFEAHIELVVGDQVINGKSIMAIMMVAAGKGTQLELRTDGPDEEQAETELVALVADRFGEPE